MLFVDCARHDEAETTIVTVYGRRAAEPFRIACLFAHRMRGVLLAVSFPFYAIYCQRIPIWGDSKKEDISPCSVQDVLPG